MTVLISPGPPSVVWQGKGVDREKHMTVLISPGPPPVVWQGRGSICDPLSEKNIHRKTTGPRPGVRDRESEKKTQPITMPSETGVLIR